MPTVSIKQHSKEKGAEAQRKDTNIQDLQGGILTKDPKEDRAENPEKESYH